MNTSSALHPVHSNHSGQASPSGTGAPTPPPINASESEWLDYAATVGERYGIPGQVVIQMIKGKGSPNFGGSISSSDGSGERLYGPMLVHGGLLEGGAYAGPGGHGLLKEDGSPLSPADLKNNPAAGIHAGVQHLSQLVDMYDGDVQMAINHYETGDPTNSDHQFGNLASQCTDDCHETGAEQSGPGPHTGGAHPSSTTRPAPVSRLLTTPQVGGGHSAGGGHAAHAGGGGHAAHAGGARAPSSTSPLATTPTPVARLESTPTVGGGHAGGHSGATTSPYTGSSPGPLTGDIAPGEGSSDPNDHVGDASHGHGFLLNADAHNSAMEKMYGKPAGDVISNLISRLDAMGAYNPGQTPEQKVTGAYVIMNLIMKHDMAPPSLFANETEAGLFYGQAKLMAMDNDGAGLRDLIESKGGNTFGLSDAELVSIWGTNEHNNLHAIMFGNRELANAVHMTSLNDNDGHEKDGMNPGLSGGYNNKGEYPQWGWFEALQKVSGWFSGL